MYHASTYVCSLKVTWTTDLYMLYVYIHRAKYSHCLRVSKFSLSWKLLYQQQLIGSLTEQNWNGFLWQHCMFYVALCTCRAGTYGANLYSTTEIHLYLIALRCFVGTNALGIWTQLILHASISCNRCFCTNIHTGLHRCSPVLLVNMFCLFKHVCDSESQQDRTIYI